MVARRTEQELVAEPRPKLVDEPDCLAELAEHAFEAKEAERFEEDFEMAENRLALRKHLSCLEVAAVADLAGQDNSPVNGQWITLLASQRILDKIYTLYYYCTGIKNVVTYGNTS